MNKSKYKIKNKIVVKISENKSKKIKRNSKFFNRKMEKQNYRKILKFTGKELRIRKSKWSRFYKIKTFNLKSS